MHPLDRRVVDWLFVDEQATNSRIIANYQNVMGEVGQYVALFRRKRVPWTIPFRWWNNLHGSVTRDCFYK
jgi:hypothetical protein